MIKKSEPNDKTSQRIWFEKHQSRSQNILRYRSGTYYFINGSRMWITSLAQKCSHIYLKAIP